MKLINVKMVCNNVVDKCAQAHVRYKMTSITMSVISIQLYIYLFMCCGKSHGIWRHRQGTFLIDLMIIRNAAIIFTLS